MESFIGFIRMPGEKADVAERVLPAAEAEKVPEQSV